MRGIFMDLGKRKNYIGGTDCSKILGLSKYGTPLSVWAEKTGEIVPEDISGKLNVKLGTKLEQTVAELFTEETGLKVVRANETKFHPKYDFLGANIDRKIVGQNVGLECKYFSAWRAKEFADNEAPADAIFQCLHYLNVTGYDKWYLCALIGNENLIIKEFRKDDKLLESIEKKEVDFWNKYIVPKVAPTVIYKNDSDILYQLYPNANEELIDFDNSANDILDNLESLKADKKNLEGLIEQQENTIKAMIKDNLGGKTDKHKFTWKNQISKRLDTKVLKENEPILYERYLKEINTRVFRVGKLK